MNLYKKLQNEWLADQRTYQEYSDHYDIINSTEFIEDYFLKLDWD